MSNAWKIKLEGGPHDGVKMTRDQIGKVLLLPPFSEESGHYVLDRLEGDVKYYTWNPSAWSPPAYDAQPVDVTVRKARIGWWVEGEWCPTAAIRDHRIAKLSRDRPS